jgi:1-deoxy-D-xylulose-5-phosphate synthase
MTGGHLGLGPRRGRADRGDPLRVRHAEGQADLGRRPPGLSAQDPDRRRDRIRTLRQGGGLSGFTKRAESEYDPFGAAHSSTSISAGARLCRGQRSCRASRGNGIAVIGDGAMSAGMAYEAMNNAGAGGQPADRHPQRQRHVDRAAGGRRCRPISRARSSAYPEPAQPRARFRASTCLKPLHRAAQGRRIRPRLAMGGTLFEELGFYYVGPIDGHNLGSCAGAENVRDGRRAVPGPCRDQKGKGYAPAEAAPTSITASRSSTSSPASRPRRRRPAELHRRVRQSPDRRSDATTRIVRDHRRHASGTGLDKFAEASSRPRCFDVGIAEQHAVTFAAGLAAEG